MVFLRSAIRETLEALDVEEFQTRTGETVEQAKEMLAELRVILRKTQ